MSSSVWNRQTDRPNTPSQINRPRRVGSVRDESFMHTQENRNTHTRTSIKYSYSKLPLEPSALNRSGKSARNSKLETKGKNICSTQTFLPALAQFFFFVFFFFCGTGESVASGIACLVADGVCVDSLCFHLPCGQTARPKKTFSWFLEPSFVR